MADDPTEPLAPQGAAMSSREADLARQIDQLISKLVSGTATTQDRAKLQELSELRSKLMRPSFPTRSEERRRRLA